MKKLQILFFFVYSLFLNGQNLLKVEYKISHHTKPSELTNKEVKIDINTSKLINKVKDEADSLFKYTLLSDGKKSFYFKTIENIPFNYSKIQIAVLNYYINHNFYINTSEKYIFEYFDGMGDKFLIKLDYNPIEWEILKETKNVQGYTCYKAIAKLKDNKFNIKTLDVWFAPEINNSHGPYIAFGLPGIVLELNTDMYKVFATKISFDLKDEEILKLDIPKYKITTKDELNERVKRMRQ
jgi:GLPGLI family protein